MSRKNLKLLSLALPLISVAAFAQTPSPSTLRAGAAMVDITPQLSELPVKTDSIRDHLFARAIVVASGNTCAVIVALDQVGSG